MIRPRHPKPDANQAAIFKQCEDWGAVVWNTSSLGGKKLDGVIFMWGLALPVEVKMPGHENDFTEGEIEGMRELSSVGVFPLVVTAFDQIRRWFEVTAEIR